jgi:hypothetical protein
LTLALAPEPADAGASVAPIRLLIFDPVEDKDRVHLLKNFEHFLGSKENLTAIIGVLGAVAASLIGALIGGYMTSQSALRAQKQAAEDQRQRDQETEQRAVNGTLQAIAAELKILKADMLDPLEEILKERPQEREQVRKNNLNDPLPLAMPRSEQNPFIVFESNAAALGRINDEKVREQIIRVYGLARGVLDCLNTHARNFEYWHSLHNVDHERSRIGKMLENLEITLRNGLSDLQRELGELLSMVEKYLNP